MKLVVLLGILVGILVAPVSSAAAPVRSADTAIASPTASMTAPTFHGTISYISPELRARMTSWRPGCPVHPRDLRLLTVDHWGFDGAVHRGWLIVHENWARRMLGVMRKLFDARFPIRRIRLVDRYGSDDDLSMAANNTSAFNCRRVAGTTRWSEHAYGRAIDVNPIQNPYVTSSGTVSPPAGAKYANRSLRLPGMIHRGDKVVSAFAAIGWEWGGYWRYSKDYMHFSSTGR